MNVKGQFGGVGVILMAAVAVIIMVALFTPAITQPIGQMTQTSTIINRTVTAPAAGSSTDGLLVGQAAYNVVVTNASSGEVVPATNYTITNYVVTSTGELKTRFTSKAGSDIGWQAKSINVTYTYEPYGYDTSSGNRAVHTLILLIVALVIGLATVSMVFPSIREWVGID